MSALSIAAKVRRLDLDCPSKTSSRLSALGGGYTSSTSTRRRLRSCDTRCAIRLILGARSPCPFRPCPPLADRGQGQEGAHPFVQARLSGETAGLCRPARHTAAHRVEAPRDFGPSWRRGIFGARAPISTSRSARDHCRANRGDEPPSAILFAEQLGHRCISAHGTGPTPSTRAFRNSGGATFNSA